jgi:endonuclease-3
MFFRTFMVSYPYSCPASPRCRCAGWVYHDRLEGGYSVEDEDIHQVIRLLRREVGRLREPAVTRVSRSRDPFKVLVSCVISLRTKDEVTGEASARLFEAADTAERMGNLTERKIEKLIYPAGFYRVKARNIREISRRITREYGGRVPDTIDELLTLPGVGRKTANLVVSVGYGKPGICVDTHVHRISNRLGYVRTRTPRETEFALRDKLPPKYWIDFNDLLVTYGQNICTPVSPRCSICGLAALCDRVEVERSR